MVSLRKILGVVAIPTVMLPLVAALAAADDAPGRSGNVWGLVMEKQDLSITVKVDGENQPVKYVWSPKQASPRLLVDLKSIFTVARVQVTYRSNKDTDTRELIAIKKARAKGTGVVTGVVVDNHGWWIEVRPRSGPVDGYAVNFPFGPREDPKVKADKEALMARVKALQKGDNVSIRYFTDFERHRIAALEKRETPAK